MTAPSNGLNPAKAKARSRISNHRDLLPNCDGRSCHARRYRDIVAAIIIDQGGLARMSEARLQLIRRFSASAVLAEALEGRLANGENIDIAQHALLTSSMVRVAQRIGVNRSAKEIVQHPLEYASSFDKKKKFKEISA